MSYQAAGFNPNQTAIRSVQAQATGANNAAATAPVYQPIRYAKDLQAAQAQPETVNTAADAMAASATATTATSATVTTATVTTATGGAASAAHSSGSSDQAQTQSAYATAQALDSEVAKDQRDIAAVMWLASLIFLMIPGMLVLLNSNASPYLKQQAREALNWTSTFVLGSIACTILTLIFIGGPLQILLSVAHLVFCLMGANAARNGNAFRVPMTWRPLQD